MPKAKPFIIIDWAYNVIDSPSFPSFDDAWDWIYANAERLGCADGDFQDLEVIESKGTREARYLHGHGSNQRKALT